MLESSVKVTVQVNGRPHVWPLTAQNPLNWFL